MSALVTILALIVILYLGWGVIYQLSYAILGLFYRKKNWLKSSKEARMAIFIPAYREDAVIVDTARKAAADAYQNKEVIIIADSLEPTTLAALRQLPIRMEVVSFPKSTKSKALNVTLQRLVDESFDIAVILDADNEMSPAFLPRVNAAFGQGIRILQGRRAAKNNDTTMAVLDGLSEDINNHILCKGHSVAGLSARLAGSGMAFDYALFADIMPSVDAIGGFDKELELRFTKCGEHVQYDHHAEILDEKVRKGDHFSRQRSRWIAAQFHYARHFFPTALGRLFTRGQLDHFNKACQMLLPPRLITPGVLAIGAGVLAILGFSTLSLLWAGILALNLLTFMLGMPGYAWQSPYRDALLRVPMAFVQALRSLLGLRKANKQFIHTPHGE